MQRCIRCKRCSPTLQLIFYCLIVFPLERAENYQDLIVIDFQTLDNQSQSFVSHHHQNKCLYFSVDQETGLAATASSLGASTHELA